MSLSCKRHWQKTHNRVRETGYHSRLFKFHTSFNIVRKKASNVPSTETNPFSNRRWTRRGLLTATTAFIGALAGCSSPVEFSSDERTAELTVQTTQTLSEAVQWGAGLWNANPSPTADRLVWNQLGTQPAFDERLADHFATGADVASSDGRADPPFRVSTAIAEGAGTGEAFVDGTVDVAGVASRRSKQKPAASFGDRADAVNRHHLARDGWVFIVSPALAEAGINPLTADQIRRVFAGDITTWQTLGGPDETPFVFLGPDVSGNWDTSYEEFFRAGDTVPTAPDYRAGQTSQLVSAAAERDNALGVIPAEDVRVAHERGVPTLDVIVDEERQRIYDEGYPHD